MAKGPAMSKQEAIRCLEIGIEIAEQCIEKIIRLLVLGRWV